MTAPRGYTRTVELSPASASIADSASRRRKKDAGLGDTAESGDSRPETCEDGLNGVLRPRFSVVGVRPVPNAGRPRPIIAPGARRHPQRGTDHGVMPSPPPAPQPMPTVLDPMMAQLAAALPAREDRYGFEFKWDGIRAIAFADGEHLRLQTRTRKDVTYRYPELGGIPRALSGRRAVLDGEIVALDDHGRPSFEQLQQRMGLTAET